MSGAGGGGGPETVYQQYNVRGDGNCFYRSLFNAALYHKDPTVFERLLRCFGLTKAALESQANAMAVAATANKTARKVAAAKAQYNNLVAKAAAKGTKSRAVLKVPSPASPVAIAAEDVFSDAVRGMLVQAVNNGIFERMGEAQKDAFRAELMAKPNKEERNAGLAVIDMDVYSLPEIFHKAAVEKVADPYESFTWDIRLEYASHDLQDAIAAAGDYVEFAKPSGPELFKEIFKGIIIQDGVFASQMDIEMIKFILLGCGFQLMIPEPDDYTNPSPMPDRFGGMQTIFVREVGEHYNFFAPVGKVPATIKLVERGRQFSTTKNQAHALAVLEAEAKAAAAAAAKLKAAEEAKAAKAKVAEEAKAAKAKAAEEAKAAKAAKAAASVATKKASASAVAARARTRKVPKKPNNNNAKPAAEPAPAKPVVIRRKTPVISYGAPPGSNSNNNAATQLAIAESLRVPQNQGRKILRNNFSNNEKRT